jgi:hypothetical protein
MKPFRLTPNTAIAPISWNTGSTTEKKQSWVKNR